MVTLILRDTYVELQEEIKSLVKLRTETSSKLQEAASHGDLKENYEYKAAREEMGLLVKKKEYLDSHKPFRFIEYNDIKIDEVGFGNKVTVLEEGQDAPEDYYLLGPIESELDLYPLVVTYHTPFAQAMTGKKVNENFTLEINGEDTKFTITAIEKITAATPKCSKK
tara:strand:+ start:683 stop:1183 length:501 start_codon:yes stop_codon:yes gene_type:complete